MDYLRTLAAIDAARRVLAGTRSVLLTRADELESLLRSWLGDRTYAVALASGLPLASARLLMARIALAFRDHRSATDYLRGLASSGLTPRHTLMRQLLLAAAAIERGDPKAAGTWAAPSRQHVRTAISTPLSAPHPR